MPSPGAAAPPPAAVDHLEAVKFVCKEFWTEIFRKQVDKLQTNHRGTFVLKDGDLRWLRALPEGDEEGRIAAVAILAFPCGLIRGALANLGMDVSVSCDFLADGKKMSACSFNIRVKNPSAVDGGGGAAAPGVSVLPSARVLPSVGAVVSEP